ncbi:unnamed protein product, partial [Oppiella nova]
KIETSHQNENKFFDDSIYYKINWLGDRHETITDDIHQHITAFADKSNEPKDLVHDDHTLYITTASHEKYVCVLPQIDSPTTVDSSDKKTDSELSAYQLLKPLFAREVCSYRLEQYWTYEICHGRYIRQFHEDANQQKAKPGATQEYYLGKYELSRLQSSEQQFDAYLQRLAK